MMVQFQNDIQSIKGQILDAPDINVGSIFIYPYISTTSSKYVFPFFLSL